MEIVCPRILGKAEDGLGDGGVGVVVGGHCFFEIELIPIVIGIDFCLCLSLSLFLSLDFNLCLKFSLNLVLSLLHT